jgi:ribosome-associated toxin RatA of RatAB toxin-antitoxin module
VRSPREDLALRTGVRSEEHVVRAWLALFPLLLSCFAAAAGAAEPRFDARWSGEAIDLTGRADVPADVETAWRVLTDYDAYPRFIPDLAVSRTLSRAGGSAVVEQRGDARWLLFRQPLAVTFTVMETAPSLVRSRAVSPSFRDLESRYELQPLPGGGVRLEYSGRFVPAAGALRSIDLAAARANLGRQFEALVREMTRQATDGTQNAAATRAAGP